MLRRLRLRGHSSLFDLADPAPSDPSSPTVLSRLSRSLLALPPPATCSSPSAPLHRHPASPTDRSRCEPLWPTSAPSSRHGQISVGPSSHVMQASVSHSRRQEGERVRRRGQWHQQP
ncbi:hypothetical protein ZWY2020_044653 [Hordeum vulgare]|nr:hypothetical protein ZWY2020_044653 [Hordeum vulgare]